MGIGRVYLAFVRNNEVIYIPSGQASGGCLALPCVTSTPGEWKEEEEEEEEEAARVGIREE